MKRTFWIMITVLIAVVFLIVLIVGGVVVFSHHKTEAEFRPLREAANSLSVPHSFQEQSRKESGSWPGMDQGPELSISYKSTSNVLLVVPDMLERLHKNGWKEFNPHPGIYPECATGNNGCNYNFKSNKAFMTLSIRSTTPQSSQILIDLTPN